MSAPPGPIGPRDDELVARVLAGDREAFAAVYDRYGDRLYDFCYSLLRHREEAADAVADTFVLFAERLGQLRDPSRLRPWLYAIARSEGLRRLKARKRVAPDTELISVADQTGGPEVEAERTALRELVWNAAAGLADRDRALLDLHLRQGLDGAELGEAMGVSASHAYVLLNRLRAQVERSLGALLIARLGRQDCTELDAMLLGWDGRFSPLIRKRVARHVDKCDICCERRRRVVSPWALLASVPVFAAPLQLRDRVVTDTQLAAYSGPGGGTAGGGLSRTTLLVAAAAVAMLAVGATVLLWPSGSDDDLSAQPSLLVPSQAPSAAPLPPATEPELSSVPQPPLVSQPSPVPQPGSLTVSTRTIDLGTAGVSSAVELANTGGSPLDYAVTPQDSWLTLSPAGGALDGGDAVTVLVSADRNALPEGAASGSFVVTWDRGTVPVVVTLTEERPPVVGAPRTGTPGCASSSQPARVPVTVVASDDTGLASVNLTWTGPDGTFSAQLRPRSAVWAGAAGPFASPGAVTLQATATDVRGNSVTGPATVIQVDPCPG